MTTEQEVRLRNLLVRVGERVRVYFPGVDPGVRIDVRRRWQRAYSDVYRLAFVGGARGEKEVILKICPDAEIQYRAMVEVWPRFAQNETLRIPRPLDYVPEGPAVVMEAVEGESLQARLPRIDWLERRRERAERDCRRAGEWLKFYHGPEPLAEGHVEVDARLDDFKTAIEKLSDAGIARRHGAEWVGRLATDGERLRRRVQPVSHVHGDFTIDNVLFYGSRVTGLDVLGVHTNVIYNDIASFLNSLMLLRLTRPLRRSYLSRLRSAVLRGYFGDEPWDELAVTFLQRAGLVDVALEVLTRRTSTLSRAILTHVMEVTMRSLAEGQAEESV